MQFNAVLCVLKLADFPQALAVGRVYIDLFLFVNTCCCCVITLVVLPYSFRGLSKANP